jgi:hypothetical protein
MDISRLVANWFAGGWEHKYLVEAAQHNYARLVIQRQDSEIALLRGLARQERERSQELLKALLDLKREGFTPPPPQPEGANRVPEPEGWTDIVAAIRERSGGDPKLERLMRADARAWLHAEVPVKDIVAKVYAGFGGPGE